MTQAGGGGTGTLNIETGGQLTTPNLAAGQATTGFASAGTGTINVTGPNSDIVATVIPDGSIAVGNRYAGEMNITDGATVSGYRFLNAGRNDGTGTILVDGQGSLLRMNGQGGFLTIGRSGAGTGTLDITNQGSVEIVGLSGGSSPGFQAGRDGTGTINIVGPGSTIRVLGAQSGFVNVGRNAGSNGTINITDGGKAIQNADARNFIGRNAGATGQVLVSGVGSEYDGGRFIGVGVQSDEISDGGVGTLTIENNGLVKAETVRVGANGTLTGPGGVVDANVVAANGGTVAPGSSPGDLGILGDLDLRNGGILEIEIGGAGLGEFDRLFVGGTVLIDSTTAIVFSFIDGAANSPELLVEEFIDINAFFFDIDPIAFDIGDPTSGAQAFDPALFLAAQFSAVANGFDVAVVVNQDGTFFGANSGGTVPEPGALGLIAIGLVGLAVARRRRAVTLT